MVSHQRRGKKSQKLKDESSNQFSGLESRSYSSVNRLKLVVASAVFFASSCFAYASLVGSVCIDAESQCLNAERGFLSKLYFSDNSLKYSKLKREVSSGSQSFEFMVWDRERTSLSKALLPIQHQRINLQTLNDELWLELNYLNHNARVSHSERSWALNKSEEVVGWNHDLRASLVHHCVNEFEFYGQVITSSCMENLIHLPTNWNLGQMAKKAKLSAERIKNARSEALNSRVIERH